jgi:hypothetical protein
MIGKATEDILQKKKKKSKYKNRNVQAPEERDPT